MTDREKLIAELQEIEGMLPPICDRDRPATVLIFDKPVTVYCKPFEQFQDVLRRAAESLADDGVTVQQWIPVTERLPSEEDADDDACVMAIHKASKRRCFHWRSVADNPFDFTHWMPMPEPPKGE